MSDQPDLFAPATPVEPAFDDSPSGQLAHVAALLDRDVPWTKDQGDVPYRVYLLTSSWLCLHDIGPHLAKMTPLVLRLRALAQTIDSDDARALVKAVEELLPGLTKDEADTD